VNEGKTIKVGVVDDHAVVREGVVNILQGHNGMTVVFQGASADEAVALCREHRPDLLLIDQGIPGTGLAAVRTLQEELPSIVCVIFTAGDDPLVAIEALTIGASGYILKGISGNDLRTALVRILEGDSYVSPEFATRLITAAGAPVKTRNPNATLNAREEQIMMRVEKGLTNRQIAEELNLSEQTIKGYMSGIFEKYDVSNRVSAIREYQAEKASGLVARRH
jgi:two-component system nitrate/nitrite response regulator NarL